MQSPPPTFVVAERYELGDVVGRGGYGMVCRAHDRKTGRTVAVKVLSPAAGRDPHLIERMLREQQAMVALAGTCAVTAVDLCRLASGAPCLVMEWLEGCDLERQLDDWEAKHEHPSRERLLAILRPLTDTLHRAHEIGIVHRDIKPANVFLTSGASGPMSGSSGATASTGADPGVRLLDFGLARMQSAAPMTAVGVVMGSPSYIAPEGWRGNSALIDHRADLYSLAVIVFRMLTGQLPFEAKSLLAKLNLATTAPRPSVVALRPDLPPTIDEWMKRALAIEPAARFQSARELHDSLILALDGVPALASIASTPAPPERKSIMAAAWNAAKSLLRRFTSQPGGEGAAANGQGAHASPSVPMPASSDRPAPPTAAPERSLWLDQSDLEDATLVYRPRTEPLPAFPLRDSHLPAAEPAATKEAFAPTKKVKRKAGAKTKPSGKSKAGANGKGEAKAKAKAKAKGKGKGKGKGKTRPKANAKAKPTTQPKAKSRST